MNTYLEMSILLEGAGAGAGLKGLLHLQILDKIVFAWTQGL